ncbi:uncharacterized protein [Triticum aestivum]|uniref:uncharacterized protein n=1 Tax=Triticum aestivum TaxID=4565 RepID=UPI001D01418D|nr:uncharacterized protein LOC123154844 [Triticum aestivum]
MLLCLGDLVQALHWLKTKWLSAPQRPTTERPIQENNPVALPLPISLCRPEMVRLGAAPVAERVLSTKASSSTQTLLYYDGKDTASSELIVTTTRNPIGRKPDDRA